jgi:tellurite resistance protein TerC
MIGLVEIEWWHWIAFVLAVMVLLAFDLGVFHRRAHVVKFREALAWTAIWTALALLFALLLRPMRGSEEALEFVTGYVIELSLSMDNVFVMALIFAYFRVETIYQHRVLFWGILGALIMRGIMIGAGTALISRFHQVFYLFGAFLVFSGVKMVFSRESGVHPEKNPLIRLARRFFPITPGFEGEHFVVRREGRRAVTPLALVLLMVETTDLLFALDSIPAIFAVTQKPFIIFTSNVFAILGLRSLYFVLAGAIAFFRFLKFGLSIVLVFIGAKMLVSQWLPITTAFSLLIVASIILISIGASVLSAWQESRNGPACSC